MRKLFVVIVLICGAFLTPIPASATALTVSSYSMVNGDHGIFNYRDFTYSPCPSGACNISGAPLSGGTGKLTDGVSPATSWDQQGENTQWVGWDSTQGQIDPIVNFSFGSVVSIDSVTVWVDDSVGNGGVYLPSAVLINGTSFAIDPDNFNPDPRAYTFSGLNIIGASVDLQFLHTNGFPWLMVGEVSFDNGVTAVPEPATWALTGGGLLLIAMLRAAERRKRFSLL